MRIAGLLLAGGRSRRFGSEKSVAPFGAGLLMDLPLAALNAVCGRVAVSVRQGSGAEAHAAVLGLPRLIDASDDPEGPLAGIRRGIDWAEETGFDWLAVAPCDAPTLKPAQYEMLMRAIDDGAPAALGVTDQGLEPLVSVWPVVGGRRALAEALAGRTHPAIRTVLQTMGAATVRLQGYDGRNVNAPEDLPSLTSSSGARCPPSP